MKLPDFQSIRWKIAIPQLWLFFAILLGLLLFLSGFLRDAYLDTLKTRLKAECDLLAAETYSLQRQGSPATAYEAYARTAAASLGLRFTIIDAGGAVLGDSEADPAAMENHLTRPEVQQALAQGSGSNIRRSATTGINTLYVAVPIQPEAKASGIVRLAIPLSAVDAAVARLRTSLLLAMGIAALFSLVLSFLAARRTTQPLEELTEAARRVAAGQLQTTILPAGNDEIGLLTDAFNTMTERLRSQFESLQAERGKLAAVLAQMTDGVSILDAQGKVTLLNPAAERMFGIREEKAVGHSVTEVFRQVPLIELWRKCGESGSSQSVTTEADAQNVFLQAVATPLGGALQGSILLLFQDLTRLRRLEAVRRDFIANISHELRTPLASMQSLAETLQGGAKDDPAAADRFLDLMLTEIDTMHQTVRELLELSRIESGEAPPALQPAEPAVLIADALRRVQMLARRNGLTLENECPDNLPPVLADSERIEQVMMNLLHNAVKFTPAGGKITVSAQKAGRDVEFSFRDSGVGVSAEDLPRIFERFYKADKSRSGGGTGLGLSIARHIVESHGGRIRAESTEGEGSAFFFTLPMVESQ
ncbi:MAG: HAMP domain-containing protein [Anaerolineales bacterium]|nr:HAMP domain-containing protein [Anaerolineales bacterium]